LSALWAPSDTFTARLTASCRRSATTQGGDIESDPNTLKTLHGRPTQSQFVPEFTDFDYRVYNATLDWDLGFATLTSATSYNELEEPFRSDLTSQFSALLIAGVRLPAARVVAEPDDQVRQGHAGAAPGVVLQR
jgi:hypothetical protein